jgi:hypothetical protein
MGMRKFITLTIAQGSIGRIETILDKGGIKPVSFEGYQITLRRDDAVWLKMCAPAGSILAQETIH